MLILQFLVIIYSLVLPLCTSNICGCHYAVDCGTNTTGKLDCCDGLICSIQNNFPMCLEDPKYAKPIGACIKTDIDYGCKYSFECCNPKAECKNGACVVPCELFPTVQPSTPTMIPTSLPTRPTSAPQLPKPAAAQQLSNAAIMGISIACSILLVSIILGLLFYCCQQSKKQAEYVPENENEAFDQNGVAPKNDQIKENSTIFSKFSTV